MSETALITTQGGAVNRYDQAEIIAAIKQTVCRGASDAQLRMFIEVCKSTGLNPWLKEIWFVAEKGIIMAARDGYLRVANENPAFDGMDTKVERDERGVPIKAVCTVWRKDRNHPISCEAYYNEYNKNSPVWKQYPSAMISKVAEVLALKRSFAINGVVSEEEVGYEAQKTPQEVAQERIAQLQAARREGIVVDADPVVDAPTLTEEAVAAVQRQDGRSKRTKPYDKFAMMKAVREVKKQFAAIGMETAYYSVLGRYGVEHSNELPENDGGVQARACYKELTIVLGDLQAKVAQEQEQANA